MILNSLILVSSKVIVTAAHCVHDKNDKRKPPQGMFFIVGKTNLQDEEDFNYLLVEEFIIHPDWNPYLVNYDADISVAIMKENIEFNDRVKPICLPSNEDSVETGKRALIAGWGYTEKNKVSNQLLISQLNIVDSNSCLKTDSIYGLLMSSRNFCTELSTKGPCKGENKIKS